MASEKIRVKWGGGSVRKIMDEGECGGGKMGKGCEYMETFISGHKME